jgi:hypothetical protein
MASDVIFPLHSLTVKYIKYSTAHFINFIKYIRVTLTYLDENIESTFTHTSALRGKPISKYL